MRVEATSTYMKFQMITRAGVLVDEYTIGQSNPSVTAITPTNQSTTNAGNISYQVIFSEAVKGVDSTDFLLSTNINGAMIETVSGSGNTYTISIKTGTGDGTLRLDLTDNDSVTNSIGNPLGGVGIGNGDFTSAPVYTVDKSAPVVNSIARTSGSPTNAITVDFSVIFSEAVNGVDISDFRLTTNAGASISSVSGSGNA